LPDAFSSVEGYIAPVVDVLDTVVQEVLTFIRTVQNISRDNGLDVFSAIITALELRIGEVFGPTAQTLFHTFMDVLLTAKDIAVQAFTAIMGYARSLADILDQAFSGDIQGATTGLIGLLGKAGDDIGGILTEWGKTFLGWVTETVAYLGGPGVRRS
jgi:hypothetical protein